MTHLNDKPFALIGVNSWPHETGELKKTMTEQNITWRTFDDEGEINLQWNSLATPSYYLIDHSGVIRGKWVGKPGEKAIEVAIETLIQEIR